eukprot:86598-Chlamydomonas_euryale.AAC.1
MTTEHPRCARRHRPARAPPHLCPQLTEPSPLSLFHTLIAVTSSTMATEHPGGASLSPGPSTATDAPVPS